MSTNDPLPQGICEKRTGAHLHEWTYGIQAEVLAAGQFRVWHIRACRWCAQTHTQTPGGDWMVHWLGGA